MPGESTDPPRPSWKHKARRAPTPAARSEHEWSKRNLKTVSQGNRAWSGSLKVAAAIAGFVSCLAALLILIFLLIRPGSMAVVLVGADYADNLLVPHNILGWEGLVGLETLCKTGPRWTLLGARPPTLIRPVQQLDQTEKWDALIADLKKKPFMQQTIMIVVGMHGGATSKSAYLIPDKMADPKDQLDLKHVIESMGQLPPDKKKVLVLEGAQISADWRLGMLHNDFARRLLDLEDEIRDVPGLWVLSAADVDQRCWVSEGLGRTVFSHYLIEALRGKAAGDDGRLNLVQLSEYVRKNVRNWVWSARGAIQEPVLLPRVESDKGRQAKDQSGRARVAGAQADQVLLATVTNAPPFEEPPNPERGGLESLWQGFGRLDTMVPHPSVYSPRRWRRYQAELVRFEELVRAGAASKAGRAQDRINDLERTLESERVLAKLPNSVENTFATNVLTGGAIDPGANRPEFLKFWDAPSGSEAGKIWDSLVASDVPGSFDRRPSLKIEGDEFLFRMAYMDPAKNLRRAAEKLEITNGRSGTPQPAEVHLLRMISHWFPDSRSASPRVWDLIRRALTIRRLAERAAAGASEQPADYLRGEQVYPWNNEKVAAADLNRRIGEDLLFSSEKTAWDKAAKAFDQAMEDYNEATARSAGVRAALAARDRALAVLPGYTHWLANRDSDVLWNNLTSKVDKLWVTTHALSARLETPSDDVVSLAPTVTELSQGLLDLTKRYEDELRGDATDRRNDDWQAATAAAAVPFADPNERSLRSQLWDRLDDIRAHDRKLTASEKIATSAITDDERKQDAKHVRRRAQIQGQMALATLGARWFDDSDVFKVQDQRDYLSIQQSVSRAPKNDSEKTWWQELDEAGDVIGERWLALVPQIDRLASEEKGIAKFADFQTRLMKADRLGRLIDRGAPVFEGVEPTARLREIRVHDLLLAMADRAWLDHWYGEDPKDTPYYQVAGKRYFEDASKLVTNSPLLDDARERLARLGKLELKGPPSRILTSERSADLPYKIEAKGVVPAHGFAVIKPVLVKGGPLELEGSQTGYRAVSGEPKSDAVEFGVKSPLILRYETNDSGNRPQIQSTALNITGTFRGQPLEFTTKIELQPVPDTVAIGPPPPDPPQAYVAVRASKEIIRQFGAGSGSIAIVLDCSGSMSEPKNAPKFPQAKSALGQVLSQVPAGTMVSLWTFSQLPDIIPVDANGQAFAPPGREDEFRKVSNEPELTIQPLRRPQKWHNSQLDGLTRKLDDIRPWFETPLVQAMLKAATTDLKSASGLRTLLVLTDGADTRLDKNLVINPKKLPIADFITEKFKSLGIQINMVFFTLAGDPTEVATARNSFAQALKRLEPPGSFVTADNIGELKQSLRRGIRQKLSFQILNPDGSLVVSDPVDVTAPGEIDNWSQPLKPGIYTLRVNAGKNYDQEINLNKGDRLLVNLVDGPDGGIHFQRALYGDSDEFRHLERKDTESWRLAVLANKNQRTAEADHLEIFAALERKHLETTPVQIKQIYPRFAWFHLGAEDIAHPEREFSARWHERIYYPGPVWHFDVPRWVKDVAADSPAIPTLTAWWCDPEAKLTVAGALQLDPPGNTSNLPRECPVDGESGVFIESIGIENHLIEVSPGAPEPKTCLVVRMAYPKDSPYVVDPDGFKGLRVVGHEHRLYGQARKYTGLFWSINQDELEKLSSLSLISLNALREGASKQKNTVVVKLSAPRLDDPIPDPTLPYVKASTGEN
jgi:hypothetical protein